MSCSVPLYFMILPVVYNTYQSAHTHRYWTCCSCDEYGASENNHVSLSVMLCFPLSSAGWLLCECQRPCLKGPGEADMYLEKHHCYSHILPCFCHSACLAHLAKWPFMCVAPHFMSAPLLRTSQSWRCFLAMGGGQGKRHPATVLMRFFLGFDGVPVALPLL